MFIDVVSIVKLPRISRSLVVALLGFCLLPGVPTFSYGNTFSDCVEDRSYSSQDDLNLTDGTDVTSLEGGAVGCYLGPSIRGAVFSRAAVKRAADGTLLTQGNQNGYYTWAEYNDSGKLVSKIGLAKDEFSPTKVWVFSATEYRSQQELYSQLQNQYSGLEEPLSIEEYEESTFLTVGGTEIDKPDPASFLPGTQYVSVLPVNDRILNDPSALIIQEYAINPLELINESTHTLLLQAQPVNGKLVKKESNYRIAFQSGLLRDTTGTSDLAQNADSIYEVSKSRGPGDQILGPMAGIRLEGGLESNSVAYTGLDGKYDIPAPNIICPGFAMDTTGFVGAYVYSRRFHPDALSFKVHALKQQFYLNCNSMTPSASHATPFDVPPIQTNAGEFTISSPTDFPIDIMTLSGVAELYSGNGKVNVLGEGEGKTSYQASEAELDYLLPTELVDLDGDSIVDPYVIGRFEFQPDPNDSSRQIQTFIQVAPENNDYSGLLMGYYLSSLGRTPGVDVPDYTVTVPRAKNFAHEGLLESISYEDLANTDLYVFRVSDGELMSERIGLTHLVQGGSNANEDNPDAEYDPSTDFDSVNRGADIENDRYFYYLEFLGHQGAYFKNGFERYLDDTLGATEIYKTAYEKFQVANGMRPTGIDEATGQAVYQRETDHILPGDLLRVVAINRATGYMGDVLTTIGNSEVVGVSMIGETVPNLAMAPPNLKIWVEREYDIEAGLRKGEVVEDQIISYEGAGLTSDTYLAIYTEWLDHDGKPLPEQLEGAGFTGRVSFLSDDRQVNNNSGLAHFEIKPGKQLQVLELPQFWVNAEHFYIQVSGEPASGSPVFTNNNRVINSDPFRVDDEQEGKLQGRPELFVPFKVPVINQVASEAQLATYEQLVVDNPELTKPKPIYNWVYRPEMQFTVYDLEMNALALESNQDGTQLDVGYDLSTSTYDLLDTFQGEKELIFSLYGEQIAKVNEGESTTRFDNVDLLYALSGSDLLTLELTGNNDAFNPLYEYSGIPLLFPKVKEISLARNQSLGTFNAAVTNAGAGDLSDSYAMVRFDLLRSANVKVELTDAKKQVVKELLAPQYLAVNRDLTETYDYSMFLTYTDVAAEIKATPGVDFYIKITAEIEDDPLQHVSYVAGYLNSTVSSEMLGQILQHDVLVQRGSLSLRREDLALSGRGPDLTFIRSYSNESRIENVDSPMGPGWSHNHNIFAQVVAASDTDGLGQYNIPNHVYNYREGISKPKLFRTSTLTPSTYTPQMVMVSNAGMFKLLDGQWHAQRGRHGNIAIVGDVSNQRIEYVSKDGTLYRFQQFEPGKTKFFLEEVVDRNDNKLTYAYETVDGSEPRVNLITDAVGRTLSFGYQDYQKGIYRLTDVTCSCGIDFDFDYANTWGESELSDNFAVLTEFQRDEFKETYDYEFNHNTSDTTDEDDVVNLTRTTDINGNSTEYEYVAADATSTTPLSDIVKGINKHDVVDKVIYPGNDDSSFSYPPNNTSNTRTVVDLRGNPTTYTLSNFGNPIRIDSPHGHTVEMTWSINEGLDDNLMTSRTDEFGNTTTYEYDTQGNMTLETDPYNNTVVQEWDLQYSILTRRVDKNGNVYRTELDGKGNIEDEYRTATVAGVVTEIHQSHTYDSYGDRRSTIDWRGNTTTYDYDAWGLVSDIYEPEGSHTIIENDSRGRERKKTDPNNNIWIYDYDELDRLDLVTDPKGNTVDYAYDSKGNKTSEIHTDSYLVAGELIERTLTLAYLYEDGRDRVTGITRTGSINGRANSSVSGSKSFVYDPNGNLTSETDWKGNATTHVYDNLNRKTSTVNRLDDSMSYAYEFIAGEGLRKTITDFEGEVTLEHYDKLNRLARVDLPEVTLLDNSTETYQRTYAYDNMDHVTSVTDENNHTTSFEYDGRYLKIRETNALNDDYVWHYDANGNLSRTIDQELRNTTFVYDKQNRLITKNEPEGHSWSYGYDANGNQTSITDPWGFAQTTVYDALNNPESVTHPDGTDTFSYTNDGQLAFVQDAEGRQSKKIFTADSRLIEAEDGVGRITEYRYDDNNNVTDIILSWSATPTGPTSVTTHHEYDLLDRLEVQTEAYGSALARSTTYSYDKQSNVLTETRPEGRSVSYTYDALYRVTHSTNALNYVTQQQYDGVGNLTLSINKRGHATRTDYDDLNRPELVTDALNQTISYVYDKVGNLRFETDKRGTQTEHIYDELNRLVSSHKRAVAANAPIRLVFNEYDITGFKNQERKDRITDAENNFVETSYNWRGQTTRTDFLAGQGYAASFSIAAYDGSGFNTSTTDESNNTTTFTYFADGQVDSITNAENETTRFEYDLFAKKAKEFKPKGDSYVSTLVCDDLGRLASITDALGNTTTYQYDANDNMRHQLMPAAADTGQVDVEYQYDVLNRRTHHIQHKATGNLTVVYGYDEENNLDSITDAKNQVFTNVYDELNRLTTANYPAGSDIDSIVTTYDANNNVDVITENKANSVVEITDHAYDLLDRLEQVNQRGHVVDYAYDDNGNRTQVTSNGGATTYTFDARNRLATAVTGDGTTTYSYQANGWKSGVTYPNGTSAAYVYDNAGRTLTIENKDATSAIISSFTYIYDDNGNRTQQTEIQNGFTANQQQVTDYGYDLLDRMEDYTITDTASGDIILTEYTFYPSYDRKTEKVSETVATVETVTTDRTYTYDETYWLSEITDNDDNQKIVYLYDDNGNTLSKTDNTQAPAEVTRFVYNSRDQLIETIRGPPESESSLGTYDYNYAGMRIRHLGSNRGDIHYVYDDRSVLEELDNNTDNLVAHYRYADRLISLTTPTDTQFYHFSSLGTTANLTDDGGNTRVSYRTDPYGEITEQEGTSVNRHVFTGHETDEETGLIYMEARYYDPDSARFLTQDSYLGQPGTPPSLNRYLYAYSNPTVYIDLHGYSSTSVIPSAGSNPAGVLAGEAGRSVGDVVDVVSGNGRDNTDPNVRQREYELNPNPGTAASAVGERVGAEIQYRMGVAKGNIATAYEAVSDYVSTEIKLKTALLSAAVGFITVEDEGVSNTAGDYTDNLPNTGPLSNPMADPIDSSTSLPAKERNPRDNKLTTPIHQIDNSTEVYPDQSNLIDRRPYMAKKKGERIERFGSKAEADATTDANGLVLRPGHESQPKWVAQPGKVTPNTLGKRKNYTHQIDMEVEEGTTEWLKQFETKPENEPDRYEIPADKVKEFNDKIKKITTKKIR